MLALEGIHKSFYPKSIHEMRLFKDLNLRIETGEFVVVVGSNGSGKSTLLNLIDGHVAPDSGTLTFLQQDITHLAAHQRYQHMSRVFQDPSLGSAPSLTVVENMSLALNKGLPYNFSAGTSPQQKDRIVHDLALLNLGLEDKLNLQVELLSGGQRQALALLMAVCAQPKLLLLDEHTAALDPKSSDTVLQLTDRLVRDFKMTTLMITHQLKDALTYGDRCIMLHQGRVVVDVSGPAKKALRVDDLLALFHA
jgi:putative ABC transport system ATP-binding protein